MSAVRCAASRVSYCAFRAVTAKSLSVKPHVQLFRAFTFLEGASVYGMEKLKTQIDETFLLQNKDKRVWIDWLLMSWISVEIARGHDDIFRAWSFHENAAARFECALDLVQQAKEFLGVQVFDQVKDGYEIETVVRLAAEMDHHVAVNDFESLFACLFSKHLIDLNSSRFEAFFAEELEPVATTAAEIENLAVRGQFLKERQIVP